MTKLIISTRTTYAQGNTLAARHGEAVTESRLIIVNTEDLESLDLGEHNDLQTVVQAITKKLAVASAPAAPAPRQHRRPWSRVTPVHPTVSWGSDMFSGGDYESPKNVVSYATDDDDVVYGTDICTMPEDSEWEEVAFQMSDSRYSGSAFATPITTDDAAGIVFVPVQSILVGNAILEITVHPTNRQVLWRVIVGRPGDFFLEVYYR